MSHEEAFRDGITAAMAGKRILARIQFEQVVEINPDHAQGWLWLAWTADSPHQALEYLQNARALEPDDHLIRSCLEVTLSMRDFAVSWSSSQIEATTGEAISQRESCAETCESESCSENTCREYDEPCDSTRDEISAIDSDSCEFEPVEDLRIVEADAETADEVENNLNSDEAEFGEPVAEVDLETTTDTDDGCHFDTELEIDEPDLDVAPETIECLEAEDSTFVDSEFADDAVCDDAGGSTGDWGSETPEPVFDEPQAETFEPKPEFPRVESSYPLIDLPLAEMPVGEEPVFDLPEPAPFTSLDADPEVETVDEEELGELPETDLVEEVQTLADEVHDSVGATDDVESSQPSWQAPVADASEAEPTAQFSADQPVVPVQDDANRDSASLPDPQQGVVLAVDDSPTVRKLVTMTLEGGGYEVRTAENGIEAMKMLVNFTPGLILLDVNMPRMDGYKLCKLIKAHDKTKHIPVVMLSGKDGVFDKLRGKLVGCNDYISKPFESAELLRQVRSYVGEPAAARS